MDWIVVVVRDEPADASDVENDGLRSLGEDRTESILTFVEPRRETTVKWMCPLGEWMCAGDRTQMGVGAHDGEAHDPPIALREGETRSSEILPSFDVIGDSKLAVDET